jgi:hypothetical protein
MLTLPSFADPGAALRRRRRARSNCPPSGTAVPLRHRLFISGARDGRAFHGRAVALAVEGRDAAGPTRYLVEDADRGDRVWVDATDVERSTPLAAGEPVIGYVAVRDGGRPGATRAPRAAIREACAREGWRLAGIVCDHGRGPITERPGVRRALDRIGAGQAAGIVVADPERATKSRTEREALMAAVRRAGGGMVTLDDEVVVARGDGRSAALGGAAARIAELRAAGIAPRAIAETLNREGVPTPGGDALWQPWTVRKVGGAWPPRGPQARPRP